MNLGYLPLGPRVRAFAVRRVLGGVVAVCGYCAAPSALAPSVRALFEASMVHAHGCLVAWRLDSWWQRRTERRH